MWMTSCTGYARRGFWVFWRKSVSWVLRSEVEGWLSLACSGLVASATRVGVGRWKSQNKKNAYLSPYVEEPLNSKVIKSFVRELRSRKCFSCFGIPMFYVYMLWIFYVRFTYPYLAMVHRPAKLKSWTWLCFFSPYFLWERHETIFPHLVMHKDSWLINRFKWHVNPFRLIFSLLVIFCQDCVHCTFIIIFFVLFFPVFACRYIKFSYLIQIICKHLFDL